MTRFYIVVGLVVLALAGFWIWSSANIQAPGESPRSVAEQAATDAIVSEEHIFCYDPRATPSYTAQLGACLPGSHEVTYSEYEAGREGSSNFKP